MAFEPELDHVLHRSLWHVDPQGQPLSLEQLAAKIQTAYPGAAISQFYVSGAPDLAARIVLGGKVLYLNPYTGAVIGQGATAPGLLAQIHQLHLRLNWMSKPALGKSIVSWADIAMLFLLATGVYLWWPLKRFTITWQLSPRRRWLDVHAVTGITVFTFLLLAGLTGAVIGFDDLTQDWLYAITSSQPSRPRPHAVTPTAAGMISPDRAMAIARDAIPGATPFMLALPARPGGTMSIRSHFPEDLTPGGRSRVEIDPYSGEVVFAEGFAFRPRWHARGDSESRHSHRRRVGHAEQDRHVAGQRPHRRHGNQRSADLVEPAERSVTHAQNHCRRQRRRHPRGVPGGVPSLSSIRR